jgi:cell wall-associated NlpC family hydrolase
MGSVTARHLGIVGAIALGLMSAACASTGATPRPFPTPGRARAARPSPPTPQPAPAPAEVEASTAGGNAATPDAAGPAVVDAIVSTALDLRGTPYRNGGSDTTGFDCSGFTQYVFAQSGIALPREVRDQFQAGAEVDPDALEAGDLIFFTTTAPGASHVAIALGGDQFVHAPSSTGVVRVERLSAKYWSQRFVGVRRVVAN